MEYARVKLPNGTEGEINVSPETIKILQRASQQCNDPLVVEYTAIVKDRLGQVLQRVTVTLADIEVLNGKKDHLREEV